MPQEAAASDVPIAASLGGPRKRVLAAVAASIGGVQGSDPAGQAAGSSQQKLVTAAAEAAEENESAAGGSASDLPIVASLGGPPGSVFAADTGVAASVGGVQRSDPAAQAAGSSKQQLVVAATAPEATQENESDAGCVKESDSAPHAACSSQQMLVAEAAAPEARRRSKVPNAPTPLLQEAVQAMCPLPLPSAAFERMALLQTSLAAANKIACLCPPQPNMHRRRPKRRTRRGENLRTKDVKSTRRSAKISGDGSFTLSSILTRQTRQA